MDSVLITQIAPFYLSGREVTAYRTDFRDLVLSGRETKEIKAYNEFYFLVGEVDGVAISSPLGEYDQGNTFANEQQHIHQDLITIENKTNRTVRVRFVQFVITQTQDEVQALNAQKQAVESTSS